MPANSKDRLGEYRAKRSADRTPEPFGSARSQVGETGGVFVVQKHAATRTHYDFRLEKDGVLLSWAVPRGPSLDPDDKRLAVRTEDHPLDYSDFEGVIPEGNYGAGAVIVWDRGRWVPVDGEDDPELGKMHFELYGYKLRGRFALVRTGKKGAKPGKEWLLIKKQDGFSGPDRELPDTSIYSGLSVEQMSEAPERSQAITERLEELGAPTRDVRIGEVELMLCEPRKKPFSDPDWLFELKYDGYRLLAEGGGGKAKLRYRRGMDATRLYPEIVRALAALPFPRLVLDGEVVVFDEVGRSDFGRLQQRAMLSRRMDVERAALQHPAVLVAFDLLAFDGFDLRSLPLRERKALLAEIVPDAGPVRFADHIEGEGEAFCDKVAELHLEGIIGKRAQSTYQGRRSSDWRKVRLEFIDEFAVVGYAPAKGGARTGFASLQLAVRDGERWVYAGAVGSGFSDAQLSELRAALDALPRASYEFEDQAMGPGSVWVEPALVVQVRYLEWRDGRLLRQPVFLGLSDQVPPEATRRRRVGADEPDPETLAVIAAPPPIAPRTIAFTNQDKIFWPEDGYTKGDLIDYYRAIYPWLAPYLRDRPLVLTRYPDGIHGKSFFQKDAPEWVPDWIRTESMWSESSERHIHYFVCDSEEALAYLANLGTIPLHVWASRLGDLQKPDWCIIDLDPKEAPFRDVVTLARATKELCDSIEVPCYVKTSGSTGLHVLIPLGGQLTFAQCKALGQLVAQIIESRHRDIGTTTRTPSRRGGKVYLDFLQNGHGQLLVAPFSVRPLPGAPVSMPLRWSEVKASLDIRRFTIANAAARMRRLRDEPLLSVLDDEPDLLGALERLSKEVEA